MMWRSGSPMGKCPLAMLITGYNWSYFHLVDCSWAAWPYDLMGLNEFSSWWAALTTWSDVFHYQGPTAHQKFFLKWWILICCRWYGFYPDLRVSMLQFFYCGFPKLHGLSFSIRDTLSNLGSAGSYGKPSVTVRWLYHSLNLPQIPLKVVSLPYSI